MKQAILDLITERRGSVSFVELSRDIVGFDGNMELTMDNGSIVLWSGISSAAVEALADLRETGAIHVWPTVPLVYMVDGAIPTLPIAKKAGPYKKPHWLPVVFNLGPVPPPEPKIPTIRPHQVAPAKLDLASMNAADLRIIFEPLEICPNGFNDIAGECAKGWEGCDDSSAGGKELVREVAAAAEWLALCEKRKTINYDSTSYGLKHEVERWRKQHYPKENYYVSNGAFLMAAHGLGFEIKRPSGYRNFPNGYLNISKKRPT